MLQYYISHPGGDQPDPIGKTALSASEGFARPSGCAAGRPNRTFASTLGWSVAAHAALAVAFMIQVSSRSAGGGEADLDVVSVTIVSSAALQSAAGASVPTYSTVPDAAHEPPASSSTQEATSELVATTPPPQPELVLPPSRLDTAQLHTPPIIETELAKVEPPDPPREPDPPAIRQEQAAQPSQPAPVASAPISIGGHAAGQASASKGDIDRYASEVALVLARNRPKGTGIKGRVTVEFSLSGADGSVEQSRVVKSSGSAKLDALALAVIGRATYPRPPTGMTTAQLTYRIPFAFE
jgi:TonB family protein